MKITIDNIEETIKKITLEVDFKNGGTHKEVYFDSTPQITPKVAPKVTKEVKESTEAVPEIPEINIEGREEKEIPEEMLNLEF